MYINLYKYKKITENLTKAFGRDSELTSYSSITKLR